MSIKEILKTENKEPFENEKRVFQIDNIRDISEEEENTVELSFSSDTPAFMYGRYYEILSHTKESVDLERFKAAAPLLLNHDLTEQIGVIENAYIRNGKGYASVRFSKEEKPQSILRDIKDKIRVNVSVGYSVTEAEKTGEKDGIPIYTAQKWQPMEISIVSVPADYTVGVNRRSQAIDEEQTAVIAERENPPPVENQKEIVQNTKIELLNSREKQPMSDDENKTKPEDAEKQRVQALIELGTAFKCSERACKAITENMQASAFQRMLLNEFAENANRPLEENKDLEVGLSQKERQAFSILKVVRALENPSSSKLRDEAKMEFEASAEAKKRYGKTNSENFVFPSEIVTRIVNTSTAGTTGNTGGYGIKRELRPESFIEILRNKTTIMRIASKIGGLVGNVDIPKQVTASQGYWIAENADATEQTPDLGLITLTPKTVAAFTEITRKMMVQDSIGIENLIMGDLAKALAITIDKAAYYGSGSSNQPTGLKNISGINADEIAGDYPTYAELVAMESAIGEDNADVDDMYYLGNAKWRGALKTTQRFSGTDTPVFQPDKTVNGYKTEVTNQIVEGDTFLGNFNEFIVASWGAFELMTDPYSGSKSGKLRLVAFHDVDFAVRHPQSFALWSKAA